MTTLTATRKKRSSTRLSKINSSVRSKDERSGAGAVGTIILKSTNAVLTRADAESRGEVPVRPSSVATKKKRISKLSTPRANPVDRSISSPGMLGIVIRPADDDALDGCQSSSSHGTCNVEETPRTESSEAVLPQPEQASKFHRFRQARLQIEKVVEAWRHITSWLNAKRRAHVAAKRLQLCESIPLGEKRFVAILRVDGQRFLIGGSTGSISLLTQLTPDSAFSEVLGKQKDLGKDIACVSDLHRR